MFRRAHLAEYTRERAPGGLHYATPTAMQEALEAEGVRVVEDRVVEFGKLFWDPGTELG